MVAQKRGRGAKAQAAKAKAAAPVEEQAPEAEVAENQEAEASEENNGQAEGADGGDESMNAEGAEGQDGEAQDAAADGENKEEEKKEEKVESGKVLVENLPSSYLFDYQDKLKELFSKHGEVIGVKRGPIIVTELTTTPTLSAIVEFKNKESLEKALTEDGTVLDGSPIAVAIESRAETAVLVGVPYEASTEYVKLLFAQCGEVAHIHEFSKTKYKICEYCRNRGTCGGALRGQHRVREAAVRAVRRGRAHTRVQQDQVQDLAARSRTYTSSARLSTRSVSIVETAVLVGVPYEASTEYVKLLFAQCGEVAHIHEFSKTNAARSRTYTSSARLSTRSVSIVETAVLVGVPYEASTEYVKLLFAQCGEVAHIHEFSKTKYKICEYCRNRGTCGSALRGQHRVCEAAVRAVRRGRAHTRVQQDQVQDLAARSRTYTSSARPSTRSVSIVETAVLVGVPYEASTEYVKLLFAQCGEVAHIHEFSKTKYKILRVTFHEKEAVEKALKLDRELRMNGFMVTVSKYRDDDEQKQHNANQNKNKRQHPQNQQNNRNANNANNANNAPNRNNNFRPRGGAAAFNPRGNFRGARGGRGAFAGRGGAFPRGGFAPAPAPYMPPQGFMGRPGGFMNDGQRPNKRLRQM
ncbi:RNA recognition motif domain-containing protein [Phthorimaea operculella]|nr:RNA recognition motif domain-containing protein [Phthorimaea operculella]